MHLLTGFPTTGAIRTVSQDLRSDEERLGLRAMVMKLGVAPAVADALAEHGDLIVADAGDYIVQQGGPSDFMAVVISGRVRSEYLGPSGKRVSVATTMPGDDFGGLACLSHEPAAWDAIAAQDSVLVLLHRSDLEARMVSDPDFAMAFHRMQLKRFTNLAESLETMHAQVPSRLARYLVRRMQTECTDKGPACLVDLGMERIELAWTLGTAPETLSRAFRQLREEQLIGPSSGRIIGILDPEGLERVANAT
jgi:CRP-like cAMP-binding protein